MTHSILPRQRTPLTSGAEHRASGSKATISGGVKKIKDAARKEGEQNAKRNFASIANGDLGGLNNKQR